MQAQEKGRTQEIERAPEVHLRHPSVLPAWHTKCYRGPLAPSKVGFHYLHYMEIRGCVPPSTFQLILLSVDQLRPPSSCFYVRLYQQLPKSQLILLP
jgi:hypothetical protein